MELLGENIVQMEKLINTPMIPVPEWAREWQTEAEHVLFLAHNAKDQNDLEQLQMLDNEAKRLIRRRELGLKDY